MNIKDVTPRVIVGKKIKIKCECIIKEVVGRVVDYELSPHEIIYVMDVNKKIIRIGSNHPGMTFEYVD